MAKMIRIIFVNIRSITIISYDYTLSLQCGFHLQNMNNLIVMDKNIHKNQYFKNVICFINSSISSVIETENI